MSGGPREEAAKVEGQRADDLGKRLALSEQALARTSTLAKALEAALRECLIQSPHSTGSREGCLCRWCKARRLLAGEAAPSSPEPPASARREAFEEAARIMCSECRKGNAPKTGPATMRYGHFLEYGPDEGDRRWFECVSSKLWARAALEPERGEP